MCIGPFLDSGCNVGHTFIGFVVCRESRLICNYHCAKLIFPKECTCIRVSSVGLSGILTQSVRWTSFRGVPAMPGTLLQSSNHWRPGCVYHLPLVLCQTKPVAVPRLRHTNASNQASL